MIACDAASLEAILSISAVDNCDLKSTNISVTLEENDPCFDAGGKFGADTTQAFVVGTATDVCGNTTTVRDTFVILRPQTFAKPRNGRFACDKTGNTTREMPGLEVGYVNAAGDDVITDTIYKLSETEYYCGYILRSESQPVPATDCGEKEFITWNYLDWCDPSAGLKSIGTQFIEYIDEEQPYFVDTLAARRDIRTSTTDAGAKITRKIVTPDVKVSLGHFECTYDASKSTAPTAVDNCDANPTVTLTGAIWVDENGIADLTESVNVAALKCGTYYLIWSAEDDCHEQSDSDVAYQFITVVDDTKPSAVATDQLNISLPNAWGARICVDDIDAGSYDACGIASRMIRIKGNASSTFAECIDIGCEYVHPDLQIELRIVDEKGNENFAWTDILVEDKIAPICDDLDPAERYCDEFHNGELGASTDADGDRKFEDSEWVVLSAELQAKYNAYFGEFTCVDNLDGAQCGELTRVEEYQLIEWPCGETEIKRRVRATDWSELTSAPAHQDTEHVIY